MDGTGAPAGVPFVGQGLEVVKPALASFGKRKEIDASDDDGAGGEYCG